MMAAPVAASQPQRLPTWALFSALIAAAGLPIYIHAPKFYVDNYGVRLGALGVVLFALRLIDVVQDPILGWLAERTPRTAPPAGGDRGRASWRWRWSPSSP